MSQMELIRYTEDQRDELELMLSEQANKVDLMERYNNGLRVIAYRAMKECVNTIYVHDERVNDSCEYVVDDDEVLEWFYHACAHKDFNIREYRQGSNNE